jgi:hypothetical protein
MNATDFFDGFLLGIIGNRWVDSSDSTPLTGEKNDR